MIKNYSEVEFISSIQVMSSWGFIFLPSIELHLLITRVCTCEALLS